MNNDKHTQIHRYKNDFKFAVKTFTGMHQGLKKYLYKMRAVKKKKIQT